MLKHSNIWSISNNLFKFCQIRQCRKKSLTNINRIWGITDHKETRYIPGFILEELLRINSSAANILIQQFQKNDYKIMLEQGYKYIINNYTESSTLDRLYLIKILENNFDSDSQYFSSRLKLIDQSIF